MTTQYFIDDERGYLRWLANNRDGYVLNTYRKPAATYLVLHRADCSFISSSKRKNYTTTGYSKICARSRHEVVEWVREHLSTRDVSSCRFCDR